MVVQKGPQLSSSHINARANVRRERNNRPMQKIENGPKLIARQICFAFFLKKELFMEHFLKIFASIFFFLFSFFNLKLLYFTPKLYFVPIVIIKF
jgi:hypothetical protein